MTRANRLGPLDPIFDVETAYGGIAVGNTPGIAFVTVTINKDPSQDDPTSTQPVVYNVVFSEPVTGFMTGDVDLSASTVAGTLAGVVTGSLDVYLVEVTGIDPYTDGDVIATIPAGVCTSIATGGLNLDSTSTDNTVEWDAIPLPDNWFDFSDGSSVNMSGANIVSIDNQLAGNMPDLTSLDQPFQVGSWNGNSTAQASAWPGRFLANTVWGAGIAAPWTVVLTAKLTDTSNALSGILECNYSSATGPVEIAYGSGGTVMGVTVGGESITPGITADTDGHLYWIESDGANSKFYFDDVLIHTFTAATATPTLDQILCGSIRGGGNVIYSMEGHLGEIRTYQGIMGPIARGVIATELMAKWPA